MALLFKHAYEKPVPLRDVAPGVPDPVAAAVMRALATEPDDRFATAESFGVALAEAATLAWGEGWLAAEQVPIMDAGPIIGAAGPAAGPRREAVPTAAYAESAVLTGQRDSPLSPVPTRGAEGLAVGTAGGTAAGARQAPAATPARTPADRRKRIITTVVVAVILIAIVMILVLAHPFSVYRS
jgi:hypothetical protein